MAVDTTADAWRQLADNFSSFEAPGRDRTWVADYSGGTWRISEYTTAWKDGTLKRQLKPEIHAQNRIYFREWVRRATALLPAYPRPLPVEEQWFEVLCASVQELPELGSFVQPYRIVNVCGASALFCEWRALRAETTAFASAALNEHHARVVPEWDDRLAEAIARRDAQQASGSGTPFAPKQPEMTRPEAAKIPSRHGPSTPDTIDALGSARRAQLRRVLDDLSGELGFRVLQRDVHTAAGYSGPRWLQAYLRNDAGLTGGVVRKFDVVLAHPERIAAAARARTARHA